MLSVTKSRLAGKKILYTLIVLVLFISCKAVKEETQVQQKIVPEEKINKISKIDSDSTNDSGEHKGIHQQEWEEHQKEIDVDTLIVK